MLVDASVAIGDHGDLAGLLAYEDLCDLEAFLGHLLSPWVVHAESHGSSYPFMQTATASNTRSPRPPTARWTPGFVPVGGRSADAFAQNGRFEAWHSKDGEIQLMKAVGRITDARCLCVATPHFRGEMPSSS